MNKFIFFDGFAKKKKERKLKKIIFNSIYIYTFKEFVILS